MKNFLLVFLLVIGAAHADTPAAVLNSNTGGYAPFNIAGSNPNVPTVPSSVTNGNCVKFISFAGAQGDAGSPCATGTNTGDVTLGAVGSSPNAFAANIAGQVLSLQLASSVYAGLLPAAQSAFLSAFKDTTEVLATSNSYGSIACNGSTDDTSAWNTLLTNAPDRSLIRIPGCTSILISGAISIPAGKHMTFVGAGSGKTIIQSNNNAFDFVTVGDWYNVFDGITFQGLNTTVTNAVALSGSGVSLTVGSTAGFPASGSFYVQTNLGWTLASYTSITNGTTFAGVTATASTTVAGGPITVKTGGYAINGGTATHIYLEDVQFNYVFNGWLNNGTQCGILDSSSFGVVNFSMQFNGANVNALVHNFTADGIPPAVAHIEVNQAGSLLIANSDVIRAQTNLRINPTSPGGVFGLYAVNTYFDTATGVSGVANSGNAVLLQGTGFIQRVKIANSWLSSSTRSGFWSNSSAATLPTDIELIGNNIYSNGYAGIDWTAGQDLLAIGNQIAGNTTYGVSLTAAAGSVTKAALYNNRIGPTGGIGANGTGLSVPTGTYGAVLARGNDACGNTTVRTFGTITVANWSQYAITDNPCINPIGAVTTPTFPASGTAVTNTTGARVTVYAKQGTTAATAMTVNGVSAGAPLASQILPIQLEPGGTIAFTYATAPTWVWVGN